jgi:hypothetical protein
VTVASQARLAGAIALITTTSGLAAVAVGNLVVLDDARTTAHNLLANALEFRLAVAGDAVSLVYIAYTLLLYNLFRPVNRSLALLAAFFSLVGCAIGGVNTLFELAPLLVLQNASSLSGFSLEQLQSLALVFLQLHAQAYDLGILCFGAYNVLIGFLIYRSRFMPRVLGVLLAISGIGYLINSFATLVAPSFEAHLLPWILLPGLSELLVAFWLLIFGVDAVRWRALQARPA